VNSFRAFPVFAALLLAALPAAAADPTGRWLTEDAGAVVEISHCGGDLCGRIVGVTLDHPDDPPPLDAHGKPQCGAMIITDMRPAGDGLWRGHISDPRNGRVYHAEIWLDDRRQLRLRGYLGVPLFGATQDWSRFAGKIGAECRM